MDVVSCSTRLLWAIQTTTLYKEQGITAMNMFIAAYHNIIHDPAAPSVYQAGTSPRPVLVAYTQQRSLYQLLPLPTTRQVH